MPITHRQSNVANKVPTAAQLVDGEIAVNVRDGRLFLKKDDGQIVSLDKEVATSVADGEARSAIYDQNGNIIGAKPGYVKLATFSSSTAYSEFAGTYSLNMNDTASEVNIIFSILLRVNGRNKSTNVLSASNAYVSILGGTGGASLIPDNGIIVQFNTPESSSSSAYFELWVKKEVTVYGSLSLFEVSKRSLYFTNTYFRDATWSNTLNSTLPTTIYSNGLEYKDYKVFHAGNSFNDEVKPADYNNNTFDANNIPYGTRALCSSTVRNIPAANTWLIECKRTNTSSMMQIAYKYPDNADSTTGYKGTDGTYEFSYAFRLNKDGLGWGKWYLYRDPSYYSRTNPCKETVKCATTVPLGSYSTDSTSSFIKEELKAGIIASSVTDNQNFVTHGHMKYFVRVGATVEDVLHVPTDYTVTIPAGTKVTAVTNEGVTLSNKVTVTGTNPSNVLVSIVFTNETYSPLVMDGVTPNLNERVLVKNCGNTAHNGIFYLSQVGTSTTPWILTRTSDAYYYSNMVGASVYVEQGSENSETEWTCDINRGGSTGTSGIVWNIRNNVNSGALAKVIGKGVAANKLPYTSGVDTFSICDFSPFSRGLLANLSKQGFLNSLTAPDYLNTGDLDSLTAGSRVIASANVLNIPEPNKSWSVECRQSTTGGALIQTAVRYADSQDYADNDEFDFAHAFRVYRDSTGGWSKWFVYNHNTMKEKNLLKYADYATADSEKIPCIYNPATKSLVYAAPKITPFSNLVGVTVTTVSNTVAIVSFPANIASSIRDMVHIGSQLNTINGVSGLNSFVASASWTDASQPYVVTLETSSAVTSVTSFSCNKAPLIMGVVTNVSNSDNSITLGSSYTITEGNTTRTELTNNNPALALIGNGARIANQSGIDLGFVVTNKSGKITLDRDTTNPNLLSNLVGVGQRLQVVNPDVDRPNVDLTDISLNQKVLLKDQSYIPAWNGLFTLTALGTSTKGYVLTRSDDFDRGKLIYGSSVRVINGYNGDKLFNNNLSSTSWNHATTSLDFSKELHPVVKKGTVEGDIRIDSILLEGVNQVDSVSFVFKSTAESSTTALNYRVVYNVQTKSTPFKDSKQTLSALTANRTWTNKKYTVYRDIPAKIFFKVYDSTDTVVTSLPEGVTLVYTIFGA